MREVFSSHRHAELTRTCVFCGREGTTSFELCPHCGRSYFDKPPRLSRAWRRGLFAAAAVALLGLAAWLVPQLVDYRHHSDERVRSAHAALVAAERARLRIEQRPHRGAAVALRPAHDATSAQQLRARRRLVAHVEASITADARARIRHGELTGKPPSKTSCGPLVRNQAVGDEEDLTKRIGRYSCVAIIGDAVEGGSQVGLFGIPFVAAVDFGRFTYVWCKDNPAASPSETGLAFVRLSRACLAARGKAFGTGYVESP